MDRVVVVGASLAGLRAAETLRHEGFDGTLTVVGAEDHLPYDRPPLSKKVLAGEWEPERIALRHDDAYDGLDLDLRLGRWARALDTGSRTVQLDDGERLAYDGVVIATGAAPRSLPAASGRAGVHVLRTLDDCLVLRDELDHASRVAVVGAGFIGAEVAATARKRGLDVTVLEAFPVPLVRALGPRMGTAVAELHRDNGVDLRCGVAVEGVEGGARVERLVLGDGSTLDADVVVIGIGVVPVTGWLEGAGLELRDGVVCDATCAAGPPGVYAAGDVARWWNGRYGEEMRVEHWTNASEQGAAAARNLLAGPGAGVPFEPVPFFWSDQYDTRIQFLGRAHPGDHVEVVHGDVEERRFVALYERDGRLVAALGVSSPKFVMPYRKLLEDGATWEDALAHAAAARG